MKTYDKVFNVSLLIFLFCFAAAQVNGQHPKKNKVERIASQSAAKISFVSGNDSLNVPFELSNNLVLMQARVGDSPPLWFILDTGAGSTVIDSGLAKDLHLKAAGKDFGTGAAGSAEAIVFKGVSLHLPNVEAVNHTVYGLQLDFFGASFGKKISGIIGLDILKNFVVKIDYAARTVNLYEPQSYLYSGGGEIVTLSVGYENLLFVPAIVEIEGRGRISGNFELDTSSTGAILLNSPFVNKNRLLKSVVKTKKVKTGGIGGTGNSFLGRIKNLRIGSFALENPIAHFYQDTKGDNASRKYDGLIGGGIFRRFKVIFDISRRRMILEPNRQFNESFEIDMSGLKLIADGDDLSTVLVDDVEPNSPAAEAGVRGGDIITMIDSRPVKEFTLEEFRQMFRQDGKEYLLNLKRDGKAVRAKLKLRRLI